MDSTLVIHIGAGRHSSGLTRNFKKLLRTALKTNNVCEASSVIEKSPLTNTGFGSCLDKSGNATSDASVFEVAHGQIQNTLALHGISNDTNPTVVLFKILRRLENEYTKGGLDRQFGLSKPTVLDYNNYLTYIKELENHSSAPNEKNAFTTEHKAEDLISRKASSAFKKFKAIYENNEEKAKYEASCQSEVSSISDGSPSHKRQKTDAYLRDHITTTESTGRVAELQNMAAVQDTVGYIELHRHAESSHMTDTRLVTSSGGNFFRLPGRISCAGAPGAGIGYSNYDGIEISCMCSGNGDDIIGMNLAAYLSDSIAERLSQNDDWPDMSSLLVSQIQRKGKMIKKTAVNERLEEIIYVGVIMVVRTKSMARLVYCHSTESFYFAFRSRVETETVLSHNTGSVGEFVHGEYKL